MLQFRKFIPTICFILLCMSQPATAQDSASTYEKAISFPDKLLSALYDKSNYINNKITAQTSKYIQRLANEEGKIKKRLVKKDSLAASKIFIDVQEQYTALRSNIRNVTHNSAALQSKYIPHFDTLKTALSYIENLGGLLQKSPQQRERLQEAIGNMDVLQNNFNQAEEVKKFIQQRRRLLSEHLGKKGMAKQLHKFHKQAYYYQAQVDEYRTLLDHPSKAELKLLAMLRHSTQFRDFFSKHSQLAALFRVPENSPGISVGMPRLQSTESIQHELMNRYGSGSNAQLIMQQADGVQSQLSLLKEKVNKLQEGSNSNGDLQISDLKPNQQKTKRFMERLELGTNLQTERSNRFFPVISGIGISIGYKPNDHSIIGVGSAYKMGWGKDIRHISITNQGIGLRSFADYKLKGNFWLTGGAEFNYRSRFDTFEILSDYTAWQKSALMGLSKKYKVSKKFKGNMQLMYDFLWKQQVPRPQSVLFRIGYSFK